jgi:dihydrofolate reductase
MRPCREPVAGSDVPGERVLPKVDIAIFGSSELTVSLLELGLVDELRIMVHPVVLGDGRSLFRTAGERISLKLLKTRPFNSGSVMLYYQPAAR